MFKLRRKLEEPPLTPARQRLCDAHADEPKKQAALEDAKALTARLHELISAADAAEKQRKVSADAATATDAEWLKNGGQGDPPSRQGAAEARIRAEEARIAEDLAKSAKRALPQVERAESQAKSDLEAARKEKHEAVVGVILAELLEPDFAIVAEAVAQASEPLNRIWSLLFLMRWSSELHAPHQTHKIRERIAALIPQEPRTQPGPDGAMVFSGSQPKLAALRSFARRLEHDADAVFEE